jgi:hypothetical protein
VKARSWFAIAGLALVLPLTLLVLSRSDTDQAPSTGASATVPIATNQRSTPAPDEVLDAWRAPDTTDARRMAGAFAAAIWTYDSRTATYEQWQAAVVRFTDPAGPVASAEVARGMLPLWEQWDALARQGARARSTALVVSVPPEMAALRRDPRAPVGWHGFMVTARQVVTADSGSSMTLRQASISVVCMPRCFVWSATPDGP